MSDQRASTGPIWVTGGEGMLGRALVAAAEQRGVALRATARREVDIADRGAVEAWLAEVRPSVVINAAAYTDVDGAEHELEAALAANVRGPAVLAAATAAAGAVLVQMSTDYVFDGRLRRPYREDDAVAPASVYGETKWQGERWVRRLQPRHWVVRTAGLFGPGGRSFVAAVAARARRGEPLRVVADQVSARTYAPDLATALLELVSEGIAFGTYHATNAGGGSWYEFAQAIVSILGTAVPVTPVSSAEWGAAAVRPAYSVLDCQRWTAAGLRPLRGVTEAVQEYLGAAAAS